MAIQTETFYINNKEFIKTYSDENRYVVRDGISYIEANDPAEMGRTYTEGALIEEVDDGSNSEVEEILNILLGEESDD